jgi:hypothetical protein
MENELIKLFSNLPGLDYEQKVDYLQEKLVSMESGEVETPDYVSDIVINEGDKSFINPSWLGYEHCFSDSLYVRKAFFPQGAMVITVVHKKAYPLVLLSGSIVVSTADGVEEFVGPAYILTEPGTKRVVFHQEDSFLVSVHPNPDGITDLKEMEKQLFLYNTKEYNIPKQDVWHKYKEE